MIEDSLIKELRAERTDEPTHISELAQRAEQEILRLRQAVVRVMSDREYIIGFNDGYDCAVVQAETVET